MVNMYLNFIMGTASFESNNMDQFEVYRPSFKAKIFSPKKNFLRNLWFPTILKYINTRNLLQVQVGVQRCWPNFLEHVTS